MRPDEWLQSGEPNESKEYGELLKGVIAKCAGYPCYAGNDGSVIESYRQQPQPGSGRAMDDWLKKDCDSWNVPIGSANPWSKSRPQQPKPQTQSQSEASEPTPKDANKTGFVFIMVGGVVALAVVFLLMRNRGSEKL